MAKTMLVYEHTVMTKVGFLQLNLLHSSTSMHISDKIIHMHDTPTKILKYAHA